MFHNLLIFKIKQKTTPKENRLTITPNTISFIAEIKVFLTPSYNTLFCGIYTNQCENLQSLCDVVFLQHNAKEYHVCYLN